MQLAVSEERVMLEVRDDGPGFPEGFTPRTWAHFGLELIESVSRLDLNGTVTYENRAEGDPGVTIMFPIPS